VKLLEAVLKLLLLKCYRGSTSLLFINTRSKYLLLKVVWTIGHFPGKETYTFQLKEPTARKKDTQGKVQKKN